MTILQNGMWFAIDCGIVVIVGLLIIWLIVKFTGKFRRSRSEILIEKAYEALKDLEDYYDLYPSRQREYNLKILKGMAIDLAKLQREAIAEKMEKKEFDKDYLDSCIARTTERGSWKGVDVDKFLDELRGYDE